MVYCFFVFLKLNVKRMTGIGIGCQNKFGRENFGFEQHHCMTDTAGGASNDNSML